LSCPSHPPWPDHSNHTMQRAQLKKLLPLGSSCSQRTTQLGTADRGSPWPSQNCDSYINIPWSQTYRSHSYRTTGRIIVLYSLIFMFFDSRREDRRFWTDW
jgi:hypothetical protein